MSGGHEHVRRRRRRAVVVTSLAIASVFAATSRVAEAAPGSTACRAVAHIGDSLSVGMDSADDIPQPAMRIVGRYEAVGVRRVELEVSGGRSVIEHLDGQEGGEAVAARLSREGFAGCWVIDLATNDAADVAAGSAVGYTERIDRMMAVIGDQPVLWIDARTRRDRGYHASRQMRLFNQALEKAHARYPALQVYEWSGDARDDWFRSDGIHFTTDGYRHRAELIAAALADAYPAPGG